MSQIAEKIKPADHGRRMSLADFEHAETVEGCLYELGRGVIIVSEVPNPPHLAQVTAIRRQLSAYDVAHPGRIYTIAGGGECKILLSDLDSERHPDLAVYKTSPPGDESDVWYVWVPEVVIEVVSPDSEHRDYVDKREEYFSFGVLEYWIFNADRQEMLVLRRHGGRWAEQPVRPPQTYSTRRLPGLVIDCAAVFQAARAVRE
ncbi:MAG: Uma2 family endonuclease [Planctomycetes bacterium]|nr:Uma2 family endonuclease [Planctomycetota bacterium]